MLQPNLCGKRLRQFAFVFAVTVFTFPLTSVVDAQGPEPDALQRKVEEICRKHDVQAMAAAFVSGEGMVEANCYGVRKRGTTDKVQMSDRFPIGSCTKSMTATLAAVLVDTGKIQWTTTIGETWPQATGDSIHTDLRGVTLDDLLSHQSGLPENISEISEQAWASFFEQKQSPVFERRRMLKLVLTEKPSKTRGEFSYSNLGYAIAAAMLETRAREPFETLVKKHVFTPLEMKSADFRTNESAKQLRPPLLWGHQANGQPIDPRVTNAENPSVYASAGTVNLTIEDFAKYAKWHLVGKPEPVLRSQATFDHLHTPLVDYTSPGAKYACGWICLDTGLGRAINHAGSNTNSFALIWVLPDSDFAAVVCTNTAQPQAFPACDEMISQLMLQHATKPSS
ncbi:MAG: serine hydrolase domain-containing protein, partial [Rubripirellula sp.]